MNSKKVKYIGALSGLCLLINYCPVSADDISDINNHIFNVKSGLLGQNNKYFDYDIYNYDINNDGRKNVFDICRMKNSILYKQEKSILDIVDKGKMTLKTDSHTINKENRSVIIPVKVSGNLKGITELNFNVLCDQPVLSLKNITSDSIYNFTVDIDGDKVSVCADNGTVIVQNEFTLFMEFEVTTGYFERNCRLSLGEIRAYCPDDKGGSRELFEEECVTTTKIYDFMISGKDFEITTTTEPTTIPTTEPTTIPTTVTTTEPTTIPTTVTTTEPTTTPTTVTTTEPTTIPTTVTTTEPTTIPTTVTTTEPTTVTTTIPTTTAPPVTTVPTENTIVTGVSGHKEGYVNFNPGQPEITENNSVVKIPIYIQNNSIGICSVNAQLNYDSTCFAIRKAYIGDLSGKVSVSRNGLVSFVSEGVKDINKNGTIMYIELQAVGNIPAVLYQFSLSDIEAVTTLSDGVQCLISQDKCPKNSQIAYSWINGMSGPAVTPVTTEGTTHTVTTVTVPDTTVTTTTKTTTTTTVTTVTTQYATVTTTTAPPLTTTETTTTTPQYTADISEIERQVAEKINEQRKQQKYGSLTLNETLCLCADLRAQELAQAYGPNRPDGSHYRTLLNQHGIYGVFYQHYGKGVTSASDLAGRFNKFVIKYMETGMDFSGYKKIGVGVQGGFWVVFLAE